MQIEPKARREKQIILFCARSWKYGIPNSVLVDKFRQILIEILSDEHFDVLCASTCQGIDGYVDDSIIIHEILSDLPSAARKRVRITPGHLNYLQYFEVAKSCDCYIGMRMHGAIMALHAGIPALALGYEDKTKQVFQELGLLDCSIDIDESVKNLVEKSHWFLQNLDLLGKRSRSAILKTDYNFNNRVDEFAKIIEV